jgi:outer membrane biosynthesis protein TonB
VIGNDGHVYQATVFPAGRPELEQRAVEIVSSWTFTPAVCHGKPVPVGAELVVHFPAR